MAAYSNIDSVTYTTELRLSDAQNAPEPDGATLTIESNSDQGTLYSYSKTTPFTGTDEENAAEIMANGVGQTPVAGRNTRVVTGQDTLTDYYAGWVQDSDGYGGDMVLVFNMGAGETLTIPGGAGTYLFDIDWGDGTPVETGLTTQGAGPHTYTDANPEAVVRIRGVFPHLYFNNSGDKDKLTKVPNLGVVGWDNATASFYGCGQLSEFTIGISDIANCSVFTNFLRSTSSLGETNLHGMVSNNATVLAGVLFAIGGTIPPIVTGWDTSNTTNLSSMLRNTSAMSPMDIAIDTFSVGKVNNFSSFVQGSQLTTACYDRTLASWGNQTLAAGAASTTINFGETSTYTDTASHALLLAQVGGIIDGGVAP